MNAKQCNANGRVFGGKSCTKLNCMKTKIFEKATSTLVFYKKQSLVFSKRLMSDMEAGKGKPSRYSCKI